MSSSRKPKPATATSVRETATASRFGHFDKRGRWTGRPEELGSDEVVADPEKPNDRTRVARVQSGVLFLHQSGRIGNAEVVAADRWHKDWSAGTGRAMRASEARFLGVSLGGAGSSDGVPGRQIDAATRHRLAMEAVGAKSSERLLAFVCMGCSLSAAASMLNISRADLGGAVISDLQRLGEHYKTVDSKRAHGEGR